MARPKNPDMESWFKKMNKDSLIRLLVDEIQKNIELEEQIEKLKFEIKAREEYKKMQDEKEKILRKLNNNNSCNNYKPWFKNWMPTYDGSELNFI